MVNVFLVVFTGFSSYSVIIIMFLSLSYQPVVDYIDRQFESYLQEELKIKRSLHNYHDSRVHACLYFISPSGHSLKSLDLVTMKKLDSKVGGGLQFSAVLQVPYNMYVPDRNIQGIFNGIRQY